MLVSGIVKVLLPVGRGRALVQQVSADRAVIVGFGITRVTCNGAGIGRG